jgi:small conductance mechanosensitive channel
MNWQDRIGNFIDKHGPQLLGGLVILAIGVVVSSWVAKLCGRWLEKKPLEPPVRLLITRVVHVMILVFALVIALGTLGVAIEPLVAGIGVAGVGIGLALQGVLGNLVAGLLIIFTKPFKVGEYIEIVGVQGEVRVIDLFSTTLLHPDQSRVVIPNRKIIGEILHNCGTIRQQDISVGVSYGTDLRRALGVINDILTKNPLVLKNPVPAVAVGAFQDSAIEIVVKPWTKVTDFGAAGAEIKLAIVDEFRAHNIAIPFPQREVRILNAVGAVA